MFFYADDGQVGDRARGREIRRMLGGTSVCRAHPHDIIHTDGVSSDKDR